MEPKCSTGTMFSVVYDRRWSFRLHTLRQYRVGWDLRDIEVAYRMFERWRQENFFKYMREEFLIDALVDYQIAPEDPTRTVPNPARRALANEIRAARADLAPLERRFGA